MGKTDCRKRFLKKYISTHLEYAKKFSPESFYIVARIFQKHILSFLSEDKIVSIFDIPCVLGRFLHFLQNQGYYRAHGIDFGAEKILLQRRNFQSFFVTNMLMKKGQCD
jgi:hypothetical protein